MAAAKRPGIELTIGSRTVRVSNPDRVFFPAIGATKLDLVHYYLSVGDGIVNALRERPCMLHRFPKGVAGDKVHQKRVPDAASCRSGGDIAPAVIAAARRETAGMAVVIPELCSDLERETAVLVRCLGSLDIEDWAMDTPADGWTVLDQIGHLAFFDEMETLAVTDPDRFCVERDASRGAATGVIDAAVAAGRTMLPAAMLDRFVASRATMTRAFLDADAAARVPWYGPSMSVGAAVTARIMETWAHGQDVFDGLGRPHPVTTALRQVAHIGVRARPNSFRTRQLGVPTEPVYVRLEAPAGDLWEWGPLDASDRVSGSALDFCLVATQRRHVADTELEITGPVAEAWMDIAQAFAGAAGTGRAPGQFPR